MMDKLQFLHILHIQKASRQGRLVVFVGAGVSKNSGVPTWSTLIQEMKNECGLNLETDELKIAQLYKDARGEKEYMDKVKEVLQYNKVVPNEIHKAILDLKPCHIITTNYDNLLEQEIENEFQQFDIIREDKDMPRMSYPNSLIKMHGDFDTDNLTGCAVDIRCAGPEQLIRYSSILLDIADGTRRDFDELIHEKRGTTWWLHFAVRPKDNRRKILFDMR